MNALEAFGRNRLHARQTHTLGSPVTGRTLTIVSASNNDQRLLALHVGLNRFPHASYRAFRLDTRQGTLLDLAVFNHHLVQQFGIGKGRALGSQVVAAVGCVGIEVDLRHTHLVQIGTGGAVEHDRVGRRQVIGSDVVTQHRQRPHTGQRALTVQGPFPVRRTANIGTHRTPVIQRVDVLRLAGDIEHGDVDIAVLLGLDALLDDGVDLFIAGPDVLEGDLVTVLVRPQHILFNIETDGSGNRIGDDQRRRGQERLLGKGMNPAIEVAVTRKHCGSVQIALDHLFLDDRIQRAAHAVTGGAGKGHHAETQLLQLA